MVTICVKVREKQNRLKASVLGVTCTTVYSESRLTNHFLIALGGDSQEADSLLEEAQMHLILIDAKQSTKVFL